MNIVNRTAFIYNHASRVVYGSLKTGGDRPFYVLQVFPRLYIMKLLFL